MRIILKHTFKNMIVKPVRSIVLILCIAITSVAAYLMIDMTGAISGAISQYFTDMVGSSDVNLYCTRGIDDSIFDGVPEYDGIEVISVNEELSKKKKEYYSYVFVENAFIYSMNLEAANSMGVLKSELKLADDEVAISETFSKEYGYEVGDKITLHDKYFAPIEFTVASILPEDNAFFDKGTCTGLVNLNAMNTLNAGEDKKVYRMFIDVKDDDRVDEFIDKIEENAPYAECVKLSGNESLKEAIAQIRSLFSLIFIVAFLLVIFITISLSNRIICERMSVIGTFRSLGISSRVTTFILLLENVLYGLVGALIGTGLYSIVREPMLSSMVSFGNDWKAQFGKMSAGIYIIVFVGAVVIECVSPIFALTKAVRTAIRDIIFANKDTEYVLTKRHVSVGVLMLVIGICCSAFGTGNMACLVVGLIALVVAVAILIPVILKAASKLLMRFFAKLRMPVASLASAEIGSKKSTVSSAVLCATATSLAVTIFMVSTSLMKIFSDPGYNADVIVTGVGEETDRYSFIEDIESVTEVSYIYDYYDCMEINGNKNDVDVLALPNKEYFTLIPELPDSLALDEFVLDKKHAKEFGIEVGDTVEIVMKSDGLFPRPKTLKFVGYIDSSLYNTASATMVINEKLYKDIYYDYPCDILVKCDNSDEVKKTVEDHVLDVGAEFYTFEEYKQYVEDEGASLTTILNFLMILGVVLTIIGTSGNQIIGFEGRRREYAVMYSTAMNRAKIKRLIFLENMISTGVAIIVALCVSRVLVNVVGRILDTIDMTMSIQTDFGTFVQAGIVFWIILMFTCLSPLRALRKMNIAAELKYE